MTRRARPTRAGRARVPTVAQRLRRGPRIPDAVITRLQMALEEDFADQGVLLTRDAEEDEDEPPEVGPRFRGLLAGALLGIWSAARRGVVGALTGEPSAIAGQQPRPSVRAEQEWLELAVSTVNAAVRRARRIASAWLLAARTAIGNLVVGMFSRLIQRISRATGVTRYIWTTQRDSRVRAMHVLLEGTVQRWDRPPISGSEGFRGHPGEPAGCRCVPWPLQPGLRVLSG